MKDAASVRDALLAHDQHAREVEAERERRLLDDVQQRERDLRRDMYDLAAQRSRASAFEAELNCLKGKIGPSTVAPVRSADIPPPEVDTAMQLPSSRPVSPIDGIVVQDLPAHLTQQQRQPPISIVHRPNITDAFTSCSDAADARTEYSCRGDEILTLRPPFLSSESTVYEPTAQYFQPPAATDLGYLWHESDMLPRRPDHTFSRSASAMTSMFPGQPPHMSLSTTTHDTPISTLPRPLPVSTHNVLTSALPCPPAAPGDLPTGDAIMQRSTHRVDSGGLAHLPPPPPPHRHLRPLSSVSVQTTATDHINTDFVPSLSAHAYANIPFHGSVPWLPAIQPTAHQYQNI